MSGLCRSSAERTLPYVLPKRHDNNVNRRPSKAQIAEHVTQRRRDAARILLLPFTTPTKRYVREEVAQILITHEEMAELLHCEETLHCGSQETCVSRVDDSFSNELASNVGRKDRRVLHYGFRLVTLVFQTLLTHGVVVRVVNVIARLATVVATFALSTTHNGIISADNARNNVGKRDH